MNHRWADFPDLEVVFQGPSFCGGKWDFCFACDMWFLSIEAIKKGTSVEQVWCILEIIVAYPLTTHWPSSLAIKERGTMMIGHIFLGGWISFFWLWSYLRQDFETTSCCVDIFFCSRSWQISGLLCLGLAADTIVAGVLVWGCHQMIWHSAGECRCRFFSRNITIYHKHPIISIHIP